MLESFFRKVAVLKARNFLRKKTPTQMLSCEIFKNSYFEKLNLKRDSNTVVGEAMIN